MFGYVATLALILFLYPLGIWLTGKIKKGWFTVLFPFLILAAYSCCLVKIGTNVDAPTLWEDWNFRNALPTANFSPFTYCWCALLLIFPKKIRRYLWGAVAMLALGMLIAGLINCVFNIARSYKFHWHIALDSVLHAAVSLYGVYLVRTRRTVLDKKTCLIGGVFAWGVALFMMFLNVLFGTSFFGLSVYGDHNIYNVVVCRNGYLSALLYFIGLTIVLALGTLYQLVIDGLRRKRLEKEKEYGDS